MVFILDDSPERIAFFQSIFGNDMDYAHNVSAALNMLRSRKYDMIFLDHDLSENDPGAASGSTLADILEEEKLHTNIPIIIHSMNPVGAQNIQRTLNNTHSQVVVVPYSVLKARLEQRML